MVAITTNGGSSVGYIGTEAVPSYDTAQWASAQPGMGERYWVESQSAGETVRVPSLARTISVGKGRLGAFGVVDTLVGDTQAAQLQVQFPNPSSGSVHHLVTCRRWWETTNASSIETVTGTSSPVVPARPYSNPGNTRDDQPLGLWRVTKDDPQPYLVADLRVVGNKGRYEATSKLVLDIPGYVDHPGYVVRIGDEVFECRADRSWKQIEWPVVVTSSFGSSETDNGWSAGVTQYPSQMVRDARRRTMDIETRRNGGIITPTSTGQISNSHLFTVSSGDKPLRRVELTGTYLATNNGDAPATGYIDTNGRIYLATLAPGLPLAGASSGGWSLRLHGEWYVA